jgi:hypothetical protein
VYFDAAGRPGASAAGAKTVARAGQNSVIADARLAASTKSTPHASATNAMFLTMALLGRRYAEGGNFSGGVEAEVHVEFDGRVGREKFVHR